MKVEVTITRVEGKSAVTETNEFKVSPTGEEASNLLVEKVRAENRLPAEFSADKIMIGIMETQLKNLIRGSIDI